MADNIKVDLEQFEIKEEIDFKEGEILSSSPVEDTCSVLHKQEVETQMEFTEIKGKHQF